MTTTHPSISTKRTALKLVHIVIFDEDDSTQFEINDMKKVKYNVSQSSD